MNLRQKPTKLGNVYSYEFWTLRALSDSGGPAMLASIYRQVEKLEPSLTQIEDKDLQYMIRWVLSNMSKPEDGRVVRTSMGEYEITDRGRVWLDTDPDAEDYI